MGLRAWKILLQRVAFGMVLQQKAAQITLVILLSAILITLIHLAQFPESTSLESPFL